MLVLSKSPKSDERAIRVLRRQPVCIYATILLLAGANIVVRAQVPDHTSHAPSGPVPREILDRPVPLRTGMGTVHEKVPLRLLKRRLSTTRGLAYLHSFVWIEAFRSFHQSLRADPNLAMAYFGLADAYVGLNDRSCKLPVQWSSATIADDPPHTNDLRYA